ncbi:hypothetical protein ShzoTeo12_55570 (plasmid) [Shinella zoogloeoides]|nr:hypothetical protein ShzoTeo12_55570 [Shinella zoogloeoides]
MSKTSIEDAGREVETPARKVAVVTVLENPYAAKGFVEDLSPLIAESVPLGQKVGEMALAALGGFEVQGHGKGGLDGDHEHANALLTTVFANLIRDAIGGGEAWISSMQKVVAPGATIDIPMNHKDDVYVRSHYDGMGAGETIRSIAAALSISPSCVSKWKRRLAETGALTLGQIGGHKRRVLSDDRAEWLRQRCSTGPFTTRGLVTELAERGIRTDRRAVWVFVRAEGMSFKKTVLPSEQTRADIVRKRHRWKSHQHRIEAHRLVFLDETWIKTNVMTFRDWAPRGQRLAASVPHGHWKTLIFIAALRSDRIDAPWVIDGPINGELFTVYVRKILVPTLSRGDVVILDNLGSHKGQAIRRAISAAGAHLLFLPHYSSDLNPIEQVFAKLKHLIRKVAPRSVEATWRTAGDMLDAFPPNECANDLRNSGRFRLKTACSRLTNCQTWIMSYYEGRLIMLHRVEAAL